MTIDAATAAALGADDDLAGRLKRSAARGDEGGVREAAEQFEGYLVQSMVKQMREATAVGDGIFGGSAMATFHDLFDQEIARRITEGPGLGLADRLVEGMRSSYGAAAAPLGEVLGGARPGWGWPLPQDAPGRISSGYGDRTDPVAGGHAEHHGLDLAAEEGTPVLAMGAGRVVRAGPAGSFGNLVEIDHGDGVVTRYAHQQRLDVAVGQQIVAGDRLGAVGSTGRSTGPHLHVEVRVDGESVDPASWLRGEVR